LSKNDCSNIISLKNIVYYSLIPSMSVSLL